MKKVWTQFKANGVKYILETVVVIMGILIAFYFDGVAESQNKKQKEIALLREIMDDVKSSLNDAIEDKEVMDIAYTSTARVIAFLPENKTLTDEITQDFANLIAFSFFFPKTGGYETLRTTGQDIISNNKIKSMITRVYELDIKRIKSKESIRNAKELLFPFFTKNFSLVKSENPINDEGTIMYGGVLSNSFRAVPLDYEALRTSTEFEILLHQAIIERSYFIRDYQMLEDDMLELIDSIEKELAES